MPRTQVDRIDGLTTSIAVKAACTCATTAAITLSGLQTIDGVTVVGDDIYPPDRVLVKDQADAAKNGIYNPSINAWTRALDFDGQRDITDGSLVWVRGGDTNAGLWKAVCADRTVIIETSEITFEFVLGGIGTTTGFTISFDILIKVGADGADPIATGIFEDIPNLSFDCTIVGWTIRLDQTGAITFDILKNAFTVDTPPTVSIVASAHPLVSGHESATSSTLTGWTTAIATGDALRLTVTSVDGTITRADLVLHCTQTVALS